MTTVRGKKILTMILLCGYTKLDLKSLLSIAVLHIEFMTTMYVKPLWYNWIFLEGKVR